MDLDKLVLHWYYYNVSIYGASDAGKRTAALLQN